jgi:hypothetical protein
MGPLASGSLDSDLRDLEELGLDTDRSDTEDLGLDTDQLDLAGLDSQDSDRVLDTGA